MQHRIAHESLAPRKSGDCFTVITDVTRSMLYEHESLDDNGNEIIVYPQGTSGYIIVVEDGFCNFDNGKGVGCWMLKDWIKFTGKNKWDRAESEYRTMEIITRDPLAPFTGTLKQPVQAIVIGRLMIHRNTWSYAAKHQKWGVSSINGMHLDFMWFSSESSARKAIEALTPHAENFLNSDGDPNWQDRGARDAFQFALVNAQE